MHYRNGLGAGLLLLTILCASPAAAVELDDVLIGAVLGSDLDEPDLWDFQVDVVGTADITSATLTVPDKDETLITLDCSSCNAGVVDCDFSASDTGSGFASLQALLETYPAGPYGLSINDGERTASLGFDPTDPQADLDITAPANGASDVSPMPTVEYTTGCSGLTDCDSLALNLFSVPDGDMGTVEVDLVHLTTEVAGSGSVPYADFEAASALDPCSSSSKPTMLPDGP